jgi:Zn-dependent peptidase ImmA (M78 family)
MIDKGKIVQHALTTALKIRQKAKVRLTDALCIYDFAEANGIAEVRFIDIPSLEEFYWKDSRMIIVSSLRPAGRQAYNCAHGFGHHVFGHGTCIAGVPSDETGTRKFDPNEFLVDCFAGFLMMPSSTVSHGFTARGWQPRGCTPLQVYTVAAWLGVGYSTLVQHLRDVLKFVSRAHAETLFKAKPKQLRARLVGRETSENVVVVDPHWTGRPVDIEVGDLILLTPGMSFRGDCLEPVEERTDGTILRGIAPGANGQLACAETGWGAFVRVARRGYIGRNRFRHLEDPDHVSD